MGEGVLAPSLREEGLRSLLLGREIPEEGIFLRRGLGLGREKGIERMDSKEKR